ncbi:hypothetical protein AVEN_208589-1 [Araneus ventricosus]|uniref:Uncharacterized protein n=1 Tax=Araneus ventricosus TaxID=182803 RepID=A0A4Y2GN69_ARAVE|nr:hypothetical protein AVEN_208589-1 [Araneus ventricosus]
MPINDKFELSQVPLNELPAKKHPLPETGHSVNANICLTFLFIIKEQLIYLKDAIQFKLKNQVLRHLNSGEVAKEQCQDAIKAVLESSNLGDKNRAVLRWAFTIRLSYSIWTNNRFVFNSFKPIHIDGSFTKTPKRTDCCFNHPYSAHTPLPHTRYFAFWRQHPLRPNLYILTPTHVPSLTLPHTGDLSPASKNRITLRMAEWDEWKSNDVGIPTPLSTPNFIGFSH